MMKGKKERERKDQICEVCHLKFIDGEVFERLTCSTCSSIVHRNCYNPEFEEKGKIKFRCDECKHLSKAKDAKMFCSVCGKDRENGLLKNVGGDEWMHVLCALSSPRTKLASYKNLIFIAEGTLHKKPVKTGTRCSGCAFDRCAGLPCSIHDCTNFSHLNCVTLPKPAASADNYNAFITIGLLDKHKGSLLAHICALKQPSFKGLQLYRKHLPNLSYFVCDVHNNDEFFQWCYCGGEQTMVADSISCQCERCSRWYHRQCSSSDTLCSGCINNCIYKKNVFLPELIAKAVEVEQASILDKTHIKFLDHFCLKLSEELAKLVAKSCYEIERYYLRQALEETDTTDPQQVDNAIEIIYYLTKKELKSKDQIAPAELEDIISSFGKGNKFEWSKAEKVEKKFKDNLQALLKAIRKDGTREIKSKLQEFIRKNEGSCRTNEEIAADLVQLIRLLEASEGWKQVYTAFPTRETEKHLIEFFYEMKFAAQDIATILSAIRVIYNPKCKGTILESDYQAIAPIFQRTLSQPKCKVFQSVFDSLLQDLSLRKGYKEKQLIKSQLQQRLKVSSSGKERENIKTSIINNRLLITSNSPLIIIEKDAIETSVLRRKILRKYQNPTPSELTQAKACLRRILEIDSRSQSLTDRERKQFQQLQHQLSFYESILNYAGDSHEQSAQISSQSMIDEESQSKQKEVASKRIERPIRLSTLKERAISALMDWKLEQNEAIALALTSTSKLALNSVEFQEEEKETIWQFCQNIVDYFSKAIESREISPSGQLLEKLNRIANYCQVQANYPLITELFNIFHTWKQDLDAFDDISIALETPKHTEELLQMVERKLEEGEEIELELGSELRKLKVVRLWAQLSLKLQPAHKATITSIQTTRTLMDRINYPSNCLRRRVEALEAESKTLNKRINLFLQKPKIGDLQIYQQLRLMSGKMTLTDGLQLQRDLEQSELDVEVQLQELVEEIKQYRGFPKNISSVIDALNNVDQLLNIRRKLLENAFRLEGDGLEDYHRLLNRVTQLKCREYEPGSAINKKDYFKFINSGIVGADLYSETTNLHRGYKEVEKAEKELLSLKPRFQNLLPSDCRRVREDLRDDSGQIGKVNRWLSVSEKTKERYRQLRAARSDISQFAAIQSELLRIPINNRDVLHQINGLRRQIDDLSTKAKLFLEGSDQTVQFDSPYVVDIISRYRSLGARCEFLEKFEGIFNRNRTISDFAKYPTADGYAAFRNMCESTPELCNNNEVYRAREATFYRLTEIYLESGDPMIELGYTLLGEGGHLMRYPSKVDAVLQRIIQIHDKFNKWQQRVDGSYKDRGSKSQEQQQDEDDELREDDDSLLQSDEESDEEDLLDEDDIDEDSFDSEESSSSHRNRKRPHPANEVVQLDDD